MLGEALGRIRADAAARGLTRTVVMAHAWVASGRIDGGAQQDARAARERVRAGHLGRRHRLRARRAVRRVQLRRPRPPARPADAGGAPALLRLAAALLVLREGPPEGQLAGRGRRDGRAARRVGPRPGLPAAGRARRAASTTCSPRPSTTGTRTTSSRSRSPTPPARRGRWTGSARRFPHILTLEFKPEGVTADPRSYRERVSGPRRPGGRRRVRPARAQHRRDRPASATCSAAAFTAASGRRTRRRALMRPHRLRVTAFGAFAGTEQVVFDDLDGLFLLHGETGAGKTTLLDAIAFALYGRVPGERGTARRLRSDHAAARHRDRGRARGDASAAAGCGSPAGRSRTARRSRAPAPPGSRPSVRLEERTPAGDWEAKSTRVGEADQEIADLMGMSAEQFFQVVLLPQGQFAQFLHADGAGQGGAAAEALRHRPLPPGRGLAGRPPPGHREGSGGGRRGPSTCLVAQVAQAAGRRGPDPDDAAGPGAAWAAGLAAQAAAERRRRRRAWSRSRRADLDAALAAQERGRAARRTGSAAAATRSAGSRTVLEAGTPELARAAAPSPARAARRRPGRSRPRLAGWRRCAPSPARPTRRTRPPRPPAPAPPSWPATSTGPTAEARRAPGRPPRRRAGARRRQPRPPRRSPPPRPRRTRARRVAADCRRPRRGAREARAAARGAPDRPRGRRSRPRPRRCASAAPASTACAPSWPPR